MAIAKEQIRQIILQNSPIYPFVFMDGIHSFDLCFFFPLSVFFDHFPDFFHPFAHEHSGFYKIVFCSISILIQKCVVLCIKGIYGVQQTGKMIVYFCRRCIN